MPLGEQFPSVLTAAQAGADWAWSRLYAEFAGPVLGYMRARGAAEPEDLVGEVFVQVARNVGRFEGDEDAFRSWMFVIAHHRVIDERRARRRRPAEPTESDVIEQRAPRGDAENDAMSALSSQWVVDLLDPLTDVQRNVLLLRIVAGLSLEQTAEIVDRNVGSVKSLQRRALMRLKNTVRREEFLNEAVSP